VLAGMGNGRVLQIIATDLNAPSNITAWSRQSNHQLVDMYEENGKFIFYLRKYQPTRHMTRDTRRHFQVTRCNHCANPPC
jgi:Fe-S-cluster-containing dehydrogenase component